MLCKLKINEHIYIAYAFANLFLETKKAKWNKS